jgi:ParB-like chromosome segregation protein Spo0J
MTTGEFRSIPIDAITVDRSERQRSKLDGVDRIAGSVRKRGGFINPPLVTRDYKLICGEQRLEVAKQRGHTAIVCQITDVTDPLEQIILELEENTVRTNLSWEDERRTVAKLHKAYCEQAKACGEKWTQEDTERELDMDQTQVSRYLKIAETIEQGDPEVLKAIADGESCSAVTNMIERKEERKALERERRELEKEPPPSSIIRADFTQWVETHKSPLFNFVHCDFPFGIDADEMHQGNSVATHGGYDDSEQTYKDLVKVLCRSVRRICTESCHFMFWFSMQHIQWTLDYFDQNSDIVLNPFPLIWIKSNKGLLPDPQRGPRRMYETCFFGSLGKRPIANSVWNYFMCPTDHKDHMSTKPEPMLRHFFRMFVDENTYMLDPTCGSGTALRAAEFHNAAYVLGVEINEEFAKRADLRLWDARRKRSEESLLDELGL